MKDKIAEYLPGFPDNIPGYLSSQIKNTFCPPLFCYKFLSKSDTCQGCCEQYLGIIKKIKREFILYNHRKQFNLHKPCLTKQTGYYSREARPKLTLWYSCSFLPFYHQTALIIRVNLRNRKRYPGV